MHGAVPGVDLPLVAYCKLSIDLLTIAVAPTAIFAIIASRLGGQQAG